MPNTPIERTNLAKMEGLTLTAGETQLLAAVFAEMRTIPK